MDCFRGMYYVRRPSIKGTSGQSCIFLTRRGAPEGRRTRGGRIPKRSGPIWSNCAAKTAQNVKMYPTSIGQRNLIETTLAVTIRSRSVEYAAPEPISRRKRIGDDHKRSDYRTHSWPSYILYGSVFTAEPPPGAARELALAVPGIARKKLMAGDGSLASTSSQLLGKLMFRDKNGAAPGSEAMAANSRCFAPSGALNPTGNNCRESLITRPTQHLNFSPSSSN
ncbi:hypothetical protein GEV33_003095 [Tenebrio molitor]|uniref:Uncharacterized protein n=1 Tax=Tenebrio molitor TaxID=7067 RepID=A0A8J6LNU6_TENMO|nr:hypothetical protein GEV33_003095 [Tenebrio molitor]